MKIMFSLDGKVAFGGCNIGKYIRRFLKKISTRRKFCSTSSNRFFITISLPLERIVDSIYRKK